MLTAGRNFAQVDHRVVGAIKFCKSGSFHPRAIDLISSRVECGLFFGYYFFWVFITQPECFPGDRTEFIRVEVLDGALAGPS